MWTDLSMKDKSDLMSLFLKQGISSLSDMRRIYDGEQDIDKFNFKRVSTIEDRPKDPEPYIDKNWTKEYKDLPLEIHIDKNHLSKLTPAYVAKLLESLEEAGFDLNKILNSKRKA